MEYWFNKKNNGIKTYKSRLISLRFLPQHWNKIQWKSNGAKKGIDKCYDLNIYILGLFFSYINFDYNEKQALTILSVVSMYKIIMAILIFICLRLVFAIAIGEKCIGC